MPDEPRDAFSAVLGSRIEDIARTVNRIEAGMVTRDAFKALSDRVDRIEAGMVTRVEHTALVTVVAENKVDLAKDLASTDQKVSWVQRALWGGLAFVATCVVTIVLYSVFNTQGGFS